MDKDLQQVTIAVCQDACYEGIMFWDWLFRKKPKGHMDNEPHILGTRVWLQELREICERNFDNRAEGQRFVRELQVEWEDSWKRQEIEDTLKQGLDRRALRLLRANDSEWSEWLDNDRFWMPGWKGGAS
ncbi:MAG: hypothetical protein ACPF9I_02805 [Candidatus Thalassarchaeaceae archaeon]